MSKPRFKIRPDGTFEHVAGKLPLSLDDLPGAYSGQTYYSPWETSLYDGGKFDHGFGPTQLQYMDYWTLRHRSGQIFNENLYAKGLIRRLITNEINTGLTPEASPDETILGMEEGSLNDWTEDVENRFGIWAKTPKLCDWKGRDTFGAIQRNKRMEALVSGDVLVVLRQSRDGLPRVQLISGDKVQTPLGDKAGIHRDHDIRHGVEMDEQGRHLAFWVRQTGGKYERLPAYGARTGRRIAWLNYGTEKRLDDVRGQPILAVVLQSLKEIDRYRDSTQRKAVINSILAMFISKESDKMSTLPMTGGAVRHGLAAETETENAKEPRKFNIARQLPGAILEELQTGEKPVLMGGQGTDTNFAGFEEAVIRGVAWANEIPPEILRLAFSNNYSASQAAINEFKIYLNMRWSIEAETFCGPIYVEWLLSETLRGRIAAPTLLEAWRDPMQYDILGAWICADWYGAIKPSTDMLKQVKASDMLVAGAYTTRARESRIMTGTKYSKNVNRLKRENEQWVEANRPLAEFNASYVEGMSENSSAPVESGIG